MLRSAPRASQARNARHPATVRQGAPPAGRDGRAVAERHGQRASGQLISLDQPVSHEHAWHLRVRSGNAAAVPSQFWRARRKALAKAANVLQARLGSAQKNFPERA
jgi:hypothetical protein